jgi:hypothetical protein
VAEGVHAPERHAHDAPQVAAGWREREAVEIYYLPDPKTNGQVWARNVYLGLTEDELDQLIGDARAPS